MLVQVKLVGGNRAWYTCVAAVISAFWVESAALGNLNLLNLLETEQNFFDKQEQDPHSMLRCR